MYENNKKIEIGKRPTTISTIFYVNGQCEPNENVSSIFSLLLSDMIMVLVTNCII